MYAAENGYEAIIQILIDKVAIKADLKARDKKVSKKAQVAYVNARDDLSIKIEIYVIFKSYRKNGSHSCSYKLSQ